MVILFSQGKKKRFYSLLAVGVLTIVIGFIWIFLLRNLGKNSIIIPGTAETREQRIKIDFSKLENQSLKDLQPFLPIAPLGQQLGRSNPFAPYVSTSSGTSTRF